MVWDLCIVFSVRMTCFIICFQPCTDDDNSNEDALLLCYGFSFFHRIEYCQEARKFPTTSSLSSLECSLFRLSKRQHLSKFTFIRWILLIHSAYFTLSLSLLHIHTRRNFFPFLYFGIAPILLLLKSHHARIFEAEFNLMKFYPIDNWWYFNALTKSVLAGRLPIK